MPDEARREVRQLMKSRPAGGGSPPGRLFRTARLPRTVVVLGVVSLLSDVSSEMIYPLLPVFLTATLGAGVVGLAAVEGVAEATAALLKLLSGVLSDRGGRRKPWVVGGYTLAGVARPLIALATAWPMVLVLRFADRVGKGVRTSPRDALIADATPFERRATAFGFHRAMDHAGGVLGPLVAAALLSLAGLELRTVFLLAAVPALATVLVVVLGVNEGDGGEAAYDGVGEVDDRTSDSPPAATAPLPGPSEVPALGEPVLEPVGEAVPAPKTVSATPPRRPVEPGLAAFRRVLAGPFRRLLLALAVFTLGNSTDAFLLLGLSAAGLAPGAVAVVWSVFHLVRMVSAWFGGRLADRRGRRFAMLSGWAVYAAVYAGFAVVGSATGLVALFLVYGLYSGLTEPAEKAWVVDLVPAHLRGSALGGYHAVVGLIALPASLLFGALWSAFSPSVAFATGAALAVVAAALLLTVPAAPPLSARSEARS